MPISLMQRHDRFGGYCLFDEKGQSKIVNVGGELLGWGTDFYIVKRNGVYALCNENGQTYKLVPIGSTTFVSACGTTFVLRRKLIAMTYLDIYDRNGNFVQCRVE